MIQSVMMRITLLDIGSDNDDVDATISDFEYYLDRIRSGNNNITISDVKDYTDESGNSDVTINGHDDVSRVLTDDCDYRKDYYKCGDKCIYFYNDCQCGDNTLLESPYLGSGRYCCSDKPCRTKYNRLKGGYDVKCPEGRVLNMTTACNGRCYNDYKTSKYLGAETQYNCPDTAVCIPWNQMCQGVYQCQDSVNICSPQLICPHMRHRGVNKLTMNQKGHSFCYDSSDSDNDIFYHRIDRSDVTSLGRTESINYAALTTCSVTQHIDIKYQYDLPGLKCGDKCLTSDGWCGNDWRRKDCGTFWSDNPTLCSNTTFWNSESCFAYSFGGRS